MHNALSAAVTAAAVPGAFPDGSRGRFLDAAAAETLARDFALPLRHIEIAALEAEIVPLRYARNLTAFTPAEQARLLSSTAAMVGLGGLGGCLLESLARSGVGTLNAADGDVFEESNLNRQLLSQTATVAVPKALAAAARAAAVNPAVTFTAHYGFLDGPGMDRLLAGADVAVDALGGLKDRPSLMAAAREANIPLVTGAVAGFTGLVATVLPGKPSPVDLFRGRPDQAAENTLGCPSPSVMAVAALMASEILRLLAGRAPALSGKVLLADLETMRFDTVSL